MTSINDIADLVQILQDHPEWRNTVRGLIVGEELANMPNEVAIFVKATNENFNLVHQQFEKVDQRLERLETDVAEIKTDVSDPQGRRKPNRRNPHPNGRDRQQTHR